MNAHSAWHIALESLQAMGVIHALDKRLARPIAIRQVYRVEVALPDGTRCICEVVDDKVDEFRVIGKQWRRGIDSA